MGTSTDSQSVDRGEAREPNRKGPVGEASPWLTVREAAERARCGACLDEDFRHWYGHEWSAYSVRLAFDT